MSSLASFSSRDSFPGFTKSLSRLEYKENEMTNENTRKHSKRKRGTEAVAKSLDSAKDASVLEKSSLWPFLLVTVNLDRSLNPLPQP